MEKELTFYGVDENTKLEDFTSVLDNLNMSDITLHMRFHSNTDTPSLYLEEKIIGNQMYVTQGNSLPVASDWDTAIELILTRIKMVKN